MASSQQPSGWQGGAPGMYFCHVCNIEIRPLLTPQPTCPRCNGGFVEEVSSSRAFIEDDDGDEDDSTDFNDLRNMWGGGLSGERSGHVPPGGGLDLGALMGSVLRNLASAGQDRPRERANVPQRPDSAPSTGADGATSTSTASQESNDQSGFRSGTTRFGPVNVSWGFGSQTLQGGSGSGTSDTGRNGIFSAAGASHMQPHTPTGHDDIVRQSLEEHARQHVHDDGMGGAGGAADGRFFNHDNTGHGFTDDEGEPSRQMPGASPSTDEPNLPPELASLRDVFSNLFGGLGDGPAGMLMDLLGGAMRGGRSGDYVWGQQGLDDVISQLMEQTRGSTAPPPASDEAIAKLQRFSRKEKGKVREARNRECSTCMDSFFDEEEEENVNPSMDTNLPTGLKKGSNEQAEVDADDPPEQVPAEEQQDELIMMPCRHLFHQDCLIPWLKTSSTCPVCRVSIDPKHEEAQQEQRQQEAESSRRAQSPAPSFPTVSSVPTLGRPPSRLGQPFSAAVEEREDTDVEDENEDIAMEQEGPEQRRERLRKAAEGRLHGRQYVDGEQRGTSQQAQPDQRLPGSFLPAEDLD